MRRERQKTCPEGEEMRNAKTWRKIKKRRRKSQESRRMVHTTFFREEQIVHTFNHSYIQSQGDEHYITQHQRRKILGRISQRDKNYLREKSVAF